MLKLFAPVPQVTKIIFGGSVVEYWLCATALTLFLGGHDSGYASVLSSLRTQGYAENLVVLDFGNNARAIDALNLPRVSIPDLFRDSLTASPLRDTRRLPHDAPPPGLSPIRSPSIGVQAPTPLAVKNSSPLMTPATRTSPTASYSFATSTITSPRNGGSIIKPLQIIKVKEIYEKVDPKKACCDLVIWIFVLRANSSLGNDLACVGVLQWVIYPIDALPLYPEKPTICNDFYLNYCLRQVRVPSSPCSPG